MRVTRNFDVSGINIRVHSSHTPQEYSNLWKTLHAKRRFITHASNALMIGDVRSENPEDPTAPLFGYFYRFLEVDLDNPWFNIEKHKKASPTDVQAVNIPVELKPDLVEIPYVFDLRKHKLYFVSHETVADLSPQMVHKLLTRLTSYDDVRERFGRVDLTVMTDKGQVAEMLNWPVIRSLTIRIDRPNPTEEDDEAFFYDKLEARGAASEIRIYKKAPEAKTLVPDEEMKRLADMAADNGVVEISGVNPKRWSDKASSKSFPLRLKGNYDTTLFTLMDAMKNLIFGRN